MSYETIESAVADGVQLITLNRPEKYNAFSAAMAGELIEALETADRDDAVRAVVITGKGKIFCAGAELADGKDSFAFKRLTAGKQAEEFRDPGGRVALRLFECRKPVIGAINGPAIGVGATLPLAMDIRLAADTARFGFVFARRGIAMESCSSWFLPRIVGVSRALEWCLTGATVQADEALACGLVRSVYPQERLLDEALRLARGLAEQTAAAPVAVMRRLLWRMMGEPHPQAAHELESRALYALGRSPDAKEGAAAFFEKRQPRFGSRVPGDLPEGFPWEDGQ